MAYDINKCKKWILDNIDILNIEILKENGNRLTIRCKECDSIKNVSIESIYSNYYCNIKSMHGDTCSKFYNDIGRKEIGEKAFNKFRRHYRYARERCCNPNNKDYGRYKGRMKFKDFVDYFKSCYEDYKKAIKIYGVDAKLSIDRIDGNKGYEAGNIRFVPVAINNQNKDSIIPVIAVNILTLEVIKANSLNELCINYFDKNKNSAIRQSINNNTIYNKTWKIFYTIKTQSTIENK